MANEKTGGYYANGYEIVAAGEDGRPRYRVKVEPDTRRGGFLWLRRVGCLRVSVYDRSVFKFIATGERTRREDPREAEKLAARIVSRREAEVAQ